MSLKTPHAQIGIGAGIALIAFLIYIAMAQQPGWFKLWPDFSVPKQ